MIWIALSLVALAALVIAVAVWWHDFPAHHFGVVEPGVLYRSGQPGALGWRYIVRKYRPKTVVNLRRPSPGEDWYELEKAMCERHGMTLVDIPMRHDKLTDEQIRQFLAVVTDPSTRPVLVHCEQGSIRTSVTVGTFRMLVQGWPYEKALDDSRPYRFRPQRYTLYDAFLRELPARDRDELMPAAG